MNSRIANDEADGNSSASKARAPRHTLAYAPQVALLERVRPYATRELTGISLVAGAFLFARMFGRTENLVANAGVCFIVVGALWYIAARVGRRTWMSRRARIQLLLASVLCVFGVLAVLSVAAGAREGPRPSTLQYWLTSNQTYAADSRLALRHAWITAVGVVWFAAVVAWDRVRHRRRTGSACRDARGAE